ncbi:hypothetical protein [Ornithinibacillus sp. FSL M8-0202]|uniref:hypothetical protein n=1 Tax=Ornithinibacillus sp. FSL M8-0202 TaxID=2921616 RepID=UPI0030D29B60
MKERFGFKELFSLLSIPLVLLIGWMTWSSGVDWYQRALLDTLLRIGLFIVLVILFRDLLARKWREFRQLKFRKWLIVILGGILLQVIVWVVRSAMPPNQCSYGYVRNR